MIRKKKKADYEIPREMSTLTVKNLTQHTPFGHTKPIFFSQDSL